MEAKRGLTLRQGVELVKIVVGLVLAATMIFAAVIGYKWYVRDYEVSADDSGKATAQVVAATLFASNDLRVGRLSGVVQGVAREKMFWGWLEASQVVKAPFEVNYFVPLGRMNLDDIRYDPDRRVLFVNVDDIVIERANVDLARTTLNETSGVFVSRGTMAALGKKVAASTQSAAAERARRPENMEKVRRNGRAAIERLFTGALRAAKLDARVEVRFRDERTTATQSDEWDVTRSLQEVLGNAT